MKTASGIISIALVTAIFLQGCFYDNEEILNPYIPSSCDTIAMNFVEDISPILSEYCMTCHSNQSANALGIRVYLEAYTDVKSNASAIVGSIRHETGFQPMPEGGGKIPLCDVNKIEAWVSQGMPEQP